MNHAAQFWPRLGRCARSATSTLLTLALLSPATVFASSGDITAAAVGGIYNYNSLQGREVPPGVANGPSSGDNWESCWGADNTLFVVHDDGRGFGHGVPGIAPYVPGPIKPDQGGIAPNVNHGLCRVDGDPNAATESVRGINLNPGIYSYTLPATYSRDIYEVDGVLFTMGKFGGSVDGAAVNLLRASWLAISFVDLYKVTRHEPYLAYARHIADTTARFQNADGSFPYRVNPKTGAVVEQYSCSAMEFLELVEALEPFGFDAKRALAAHRAVEWLVAYACASNNWKAAYEDIPAQSFYANLSQMACLPLVRYLCRHKDEEPEYLPTAIRLNRWVEDQFVTLGPDDEASPVRVKGPLVFEQFMCWWPMEGHTGHWILALIELHKATGKQIYLDKARAAANAICHEQYENGELSTWGRDYQTGASLSDTNPRRKNWYNANASADLALYKLAVYVRAGKRLNA